MRKDLNSVYQKESRNWKKKLILGEIKLLKGKVKTYNELAEIINEKFQLNFKWLKIKYQTKKFLKETDEDPVKDAYKFIELAEETIKR